jgi:TatD DNase family protein
VYLIDSHCHIDFEQFDADRDQVLSEAAAAGVKRLINPGTDLDSSYRAVKLADTYPDIYAAIGFHPYDAPQVNDETLVALTELSANPNVVAIGEIGLDYYRDLAPRAEQHRAFEAQLSLAKTLGLPVIIHQREAAVDTMAVLRQWGAHGDHPGLVLHAFSGDQMMVEEAVELGFYMGIGGPITFKNAGSLLDVVKMMPLERILIETDAPFLSPHPYRGKRNEPARVRLVAQKLAELLTVELADLAEQVTVNTETLFHLPQAI